MGDLGMFVASRHPLDSVDGLAMYFLTSPCPKASTYTAPLLPPHHWEKMGWGGGRVLLGGSGLGR